MVLLYNRAKRRHMKKLLIGLTFIASISSFAVTTYNCELTPDDYFTPRSDSLDSDEYEGQKLTIKKYANNRVKIIIDGDDIKCGKKGFRPVKDDITSVMDFVNLDIDRIMPLTYAICGEDNDSVYVFIGDNKYYVAATGGGYNYSAGFLSSMKCEVKTK